MKLIKTLLIFILVAVLSRGETGPENLTYITENYPPANYTDEYGMLTGASVKILRALWKEMGIPEQKIKLYPWTRGYQIIQTKEKKVLFSMSRTDEREDLFKWVGPIFTSRHVIVGIDRKNTRQIIFTSNKELFTHRIAVFRDDVGELSLRAIGYPRDSLRIVSQPKQMIKHLLEGKVSFISLSDDVLRDLKTKYNLNENFYVAYTLEMRQNYFAFSKDIPDELIKKFQQALESITEEHSKILSEFGMELHYGK